ncbi:UbiH/UbiF/VisC/COQ6 family ubiquinone biosynthesis hydroxylase [Albidovulum sp.]|mgnify:CR=1 FL=1|uniref:UbiH/UbiF/VisC/COQ6 family ubiquinone biosynthesis hydroxylase n=1 Tax=Albidovulum sp. TaxID=1872424 RepID=UPI001DD19616|nr:UbiH/UbiF/VisC/COQ6 family ubiquinone biosynthesis hydroxylase [Paracoccaceae bacterium]MCC0045718.1 UbiH/UbiF/VisC/COQ6 family ubiquinone biosynthesis hydroxylase [Defluviimonas sp.]HPE24316.1 UbiH/UbiF/VisC/COQ6 family ubiquinone biosynthesis hydroxylase [Albidovulum sp.]MCO5128334.1 UbiH/UbiF/VisC/COQ6 family ubiquinone biosynthesis hydroxylase [Paracoccaceae bacterium]MCP5355215.1 UbiH/UbiF/VisC/COQ6 family ubiquinone biosynthesis hydroxylase [Paracoccaceae bacterium]
MDNPAPRGILGAMRIDADVIVVGGGLNGPALALALARAGLSVIIVDAQPARARADATFDGRAYALAIASKRLLAAIGVWDRVSDRVQPIREIKASDGRAGEGAAPFFLHFDSAEIEEGPMGFMLEDRHLYAAFLAALGETAGITHIPAQTVTAQEVDAGGVSVTLSGGRRLRARMIAGCDGRQSGTARRAGIARQGWSYGQTALVCAVEHDLPHHGIAQQYFMPTGPLAILPLPGNRSSIVWSETEENARTIAALDDEAFMAVLRRRFGDYLGAIRLAGARFTYPLNLTLADRYAAPRVALVGDAAHGVHPIAGQGLNLGFRDVAALAEVLVGAKRRGEDIGAEDVLERYESWRRFDSTSLALGMDTVNKLFSNDNALLRAARDLGMGAVNAVPALRRAFIRQAAGLAGDPPKLLQGLPL